jgi:hypothetical protein
MKTYQKQIIITLISFPTIFSFLTFTRYNKKYFSIPLELNNWFLITFSVLIFLFIYTFIGMGTRNFFLVKNIFLNNRHLLLLIISFSVLTNYFSFGKHDTNLQGDILSDMFDIVTYLSGFIMYMIFLIFIHSIEMFIRKENNPKLINSNFLNDEPISSIEKDELGRKEFAETIVQNILQSNGKFVIGIYGGWGAGKSSLFTMMKDYLPDQQTTLHFTPWYFGENNHDIIPNFLDLLAEMIKESQYYNVKLEKELKKYTTFFRTMQIRPPGLILSAGELFRGLFPEDSSLDEIKKNITNMLEESNKQIVVFIDDLDRLDKEEIAIVFKLVRLVCDFPNITYVLALDEDIVSYSLGQMYGKTENGREAREIGREYLEKFIQVPLYLPKPDEKKLKDIFFKGVEEVLDKYNIKSEFVSRNNSGVYPIIDFTIYRLSLRNIKRYLNLVRFFVPILKEEVFVDDLLYLLLIKISSPGLYDWIRMNPTLVLQKDEKYFKENSEIKEFAMENRTYQRLIEELFPNMGYAFGRGVKPHEIDVSLPNTHMRISSSKYFQKYFMYSTPFKEIPQEELKNFYKFLLENNSESSLERLRQLGDLYDMSDILEKINLDVQYQKEENVYSIITLLKLKFNESDLGTKDGIIKLMLSYYQHKKNSFLKSDLFKPQHNLLLLNRLSDSIDYYHKDVEIINIIRQVILEEFKKFAFGDIYQMYPENERDRLVMYWLNNERDRHIKRRKFSGFIDDFEKYQEIIELIWSKSYPLEGYKFYQLILTNLGHNLHYTFINELKSGNKVVKYPEPFRVLIDWEEKIPRYIQSTLLTILINCKDQNIKPDLERNLQELISIFMEGKHDDKDIKEVKELLEKMDELKMEFDRKSNS